VTGFRLAPDDKSLCSIRIMICRDQRGSSLWASAHTCVSSFVSYHNVKSLELRFRQIREHPSSVLSIDRARRQETGPPPLHPVPWRFNISPVHRPIQSTLNQTKSCDVVKFHNQIAVFFPIEMPKTTSISIDPAAERADESSATRPPLFIDWSCPMYTC
jgi:hypothetical protein